MSTTDASANSSTGEKQASRWSRRRNLQRAGQIASLLLTIGTLWYFLHGLNVHALGDALKDTRPGLLTIAVLLNFAEQALRAAAWSVMLAPAHVVRFRRLLRYEYAAQAASSVSPAKAGEVLRFWLLASEGVPAVTTAGLIALKKLLGAIALAVLVLPAPWLLAGLPGWLAWFVVGFTGAMIALLTLLMGIARGTWDRALPRFLIALSGGLSLLCDIRRTLTSFAVIICGEAVDLLAAWATLAALGIREPFAAAGLILFLIDISNALPAAPAQLGTFEVGAYYMLDLLKVPQAGALAFALLFHAQQALVQIIVGLPFAVHFMSVRRRKAKRSG